MDKQYKNSENRQYLVFAATVFFVMVTMILGAVAFRFYKQSVGGKSDVREYDKYYCLITDNYKSDFWQSVYEGALEAAKEENHCLFRIVPLSLNTSTVTVKATWKKNKPTIKSVTVTTKVNGKKKTFTLKKTRDYKIVSYDAKKKTVTLNGCGNFEGEVTKKTKK